MADFVSRANDVLGYVMGLGVLVGVLALLIIGGRMIHANFTGDPWIAARGMSDLPWVLLGLVLLAGSGIMAGTLLQGSVHSTDTSLPDLLAEGVEYQEKQEEASIPDGCLQDPETDLAVCPDDDAWDDVVETAAVTGPRDPRCVSDDYANCFEYCFVPPMGTGAASNCAAENTFEEGWIWADYACPSFFEWSLGDAAEVVPPDCPDPPKEEDIPAEIQANSDAPVLVYACQEFPGWVSAYAAETGGDEDRLCEGTEPY
ncbi:hypothetical protein [Nocardiopsis coralliicola]